MNSIKKTIKVMNDSGDISFKNQSGFSLLGALIAMVIFTVGILAVFTMQTKTVQSASSSIQLTQSSAWAQDTIETLINGLYDDPALEPGAGGYATGAPVDPLEPVNCEGNVCPNGLIHQVQEGPYTIKWVVFTSDNNGDKINDFNNIKDDEMFDHVDKTRTLQDIPVDAKLVSVYVSHPSEKYSQYTFVKPNT